MKHATLVIVIIMTLGLFGACGNGTDNGNGGEDTMSEATESRYSELEIREYEGTNLDPSVGPRDNSISGIQQVDIDNYELKVTGLVEEPVSLTYEQVLALPSYEKLITLHCVEGWDATVLWKGALLGDIIDLATVDESANTVVFYCIDGYTTSLPLAVIRDRELIMAYSSNSITLPAALGYPFIVVAEDKLGYKWARWVTAIELTDNPDYTGYWESRGYDNEAELED